MVETGPKFSSPSSHARKEFFKVFLPDFASTELVIPPAFVDILEKPLPKEVLLVDEIERVWCVETEVEDTERIFRVMFKKGWRNFVNDQSLEFGDFLVFSFDGGNRFSVTVFANDGCRKDLSDIVTAKDKSRVSPEKESITKPVDEEPVDEDMGRRLVECLTEPQRKIVCGMRAKRKRKRAASVKEEASVVIRDESENVSVSKTKPEQRENTRRKVNQEEDSCDVRWFSSSPVCKSENPHFVRTITQAALHRLEIPKTLLKSNGIDLEDDVELCDESGKKWPLKIATFDRGIRFAKASWLCFVKGSDLTINSKCLFEFIVQRNGSCNEIRLRVLRGRLRTRLTKSGYEVLAM